MPGRLADEQDVLQLVANQTCHKACQAVKLMDQKHTPEETWHLKEHIRVDHRLFFLGPSQGSEVLVETTRYACFLVLQLLDLLFNHRKRLDGG